MLDLVKSFALSKLKDAEYEECDSKNREEIIAKVESSTTLDDVAFVLLDYNLPRLFAKCYIPQLGYPLLEKWGGRCLDEISNPVYGAISKAMKTEFVSEEMTAKIEIYTKVCKLKLRLRADQIAKEIKIASEEWRQIPNPGDKSE